MAKVASKNKKAAPGSDTYLLTAPEISIFTALFSMRNSLLDLEQQRAKFSNDEFFRQFNCVLAQFTETAEATHRFDVVLPVIQLGKFSSGFWRWFNWWHEYLTGLPEPEQMKIERLAMDRLPGLEAYRPSGDWINGSGHPSFVITVV